MICSTTSFGFLNSWKACIKVQRKNNLSCPNCKRNIFNSMLNWMWVLKHFEKQNSWNRVCIPHLLIVALNLQRTKALIALGTLGWWLCGCGLLCLFPRFCQSCSTSSLWGAVEQGCPGCTGLGSLDRSRSVWQSLPLALCAQGRSSHCSWPASSQGTVLVIESVCGLEHTRGTWAEEVC